MTRFETKQEKNTDIKYFKYISLVLTALVMLLIATLLILRTDAAKHRVATFVTDATQSIGKLPVNIGSIEIDGINNIYIEEITLFDLQGDTMINLAEAKVNLSLPHLLFNKIRLNTVSLTNPSIRISRSTTEDTMNIQFLFDLLAGNDTAQTKEMPEIRANQILIHNGTISYDVLSEPTDSNKFNPNHISFSGIETNISLKTLSSDSINLYIRNISAKETSGLEIKRFTTNIKASENKATIKNTAIELPGSKLTIPHFTATYNSLKNLSIENLRYKGSIECKRLSPNDFETLIQLPDTLLPALQFRTELNGTSRNLNIKNLRLQTVNGDININAHGYIKQSQENNTDYKLQIEQCRINSDGIHDICLLLPQEINEFNPAEKFQQISLKGKLLSQQGEIDAEAMLSTASGQIDINAELHKDSTYTAYILAKDLQLGILTENNDLGGCSLQSIAQGKYVAPDNINGNVYALLSQLTYKGYKYDAVDFEGNFNANELKTKIISSDRHLAGKINFEYEKNNRIPSYKIQARIDTLRPKQLKIGNRPHTISFTLEAEYTGSNIDNSLFSADIYNFQLITPQKKYIQRRISMRGNQLNENRQLIIDSDLINGYIMGNYQYTTLPNSFHRLMQKFLPSLATSTHYSNKKNNFVFKFDISQTEVLSELLALPITISDNSSILGNCDDTQNNMVIEADIKDCILFDDKYSEITFKSESNDSNIICKANLIHTGRINSDKKSNDIIFNITSEIGNDRLANKIDWKSNNSPTTSGNLKFDISMYKNHDGNIGFNARLQPGLIIYEDDAWTLSQSDITGDGNKFQIENFVLRNKERALNINGVIGDNEDDKLDISMKDIVLEDIFDILNFHPVEFGGIATGNINLSRILGDFTLNSRLKVNNFKFEKGYLGEMDFAGTWDEEHKAIILQARIEDGEKANTLVDGFVSPANDTINLHIQANNSRIAFLNNMLPSILSDVEGVVNGSLRIKGGLSNINLYGSMAPVGKIRLRPTNCVYNLIGDSIRFVYNDIKFENLRIKDLHNNTGEINGGVHHDCLKNFTCDFDIQANNLLAYYSPDFGNESFYGTAFVTGDAGISVNESGTFLNAKFTPGRNSKFIYNAASSMNASSNEFITFIDRNKIKDKEKDQEKKNNHIIENIESRMRLDFMIDVTPEMQLRVYTNTITDDYLDLYGSGDINAVCDEKEGFSMQGNMNLDRGVYKFTMQEIFPKEFNIQEGSTLKFNGDPFLANLNLRTVYTVQSASLRDLTINADKRTNVKVNCLMDITGTLAAPNLTFGLELPNGNEEEREILASATSTPEQINMQFIYLLGIGKFYTYDYNNNQENDNQSSTVMESLISSTISGQLNNMLSQITDNDNWNISGNFTTSEKGWNSMEVEGILSGRLLNNRLLINGNFGYRDNPIANKNFIGDFEVQWLLNKNGNISLKAYNKTNNRYFSKTTLTTQGAGILLKHDFNGWKFWEKE